MNQTNIQILVAFPAGACAFYRTTGVFPFIPNVKIDILDKVHWQSIQSSSGKIPDIMLMERPDNENFVQSMKFAKDLGIKVWIDYDDDLLSLEKDNPGFGFYSNARVRDAIEYCLKNADYVTVSTENIEWTYRKYNKNIRVIPNALNDNYFKLMERNNKSGSLAWRGSKTHRYDIMTYADSIWQIANEFEEWKWNFFGEDLWYIHQSIGPLKGIKNSYEVGSRELVSYMNDLKNSKPEIIFVPLVFNHFNECKSNIAWLEGTFAGAACLAPSMTEWNHPGIMTYGNDMEFYGGFVRLLNDPKLRRELYLESVQTIREKFLLSDVNKKRSEVIEYLRG